ncbi:hypothetical protein ROS217_02060 [Roseovarius sp. 217]|nr:hypothetical protein ROS217_02060 [Roseovarius sp. 217]
MSQSFDAQLHFSTVALMEQPFDIPFKV